MLMIVGAVNYRHASPLNVIDEDMECPEGILDGSNHTLDLVGISEIHRQGDMGSVEPLKLFFHLFGGFRPIKIRENKIGPFLGESPGDFPADRS